MDGITALKCSSCGWGDRMERIIKPNFVHEDERGVLREITRGRHWRQLNEYERKKGCVVGNHYHKGFEEFFYIIKGKASVKIKNVQSGEEEAFTVQAGDAFFVKKLEAHALRFEEDTIFITLLSENFDRESKDIFPFDVGI